MTAPLAETRSVTKKFGENLAVDRIDLTVRAGDVVGLVGANGAGKTTLIRMLVGLLTPDSGEVRLLGERPSRSTRHHIGYMPQGLGLYEDLTVAENLRFTARAFGVAMPELDDDLASLSDSLITDVPLGIRRRIAFVAALCHRPDLLVLDEPTSGVGPLGRANLWETIHSAADAGAGVLVTTHHMDEAEQCDRLMFLSSGRELITGTVDEILSGRITVEVAPVDTIAALGALEHAGLPVLPAGRTLRLPGVPMATARSVLGDVITMVEKPSSLEEAFMTFASES
jgi:ABC-2 type transport system ATP-binding protein/ribosome-dependent ATPase